MLYQAMLGERSLVISAAHLKLIDRARTVVVCPPQSGGPCFPQFSGLQRGDRDDSTIFIAALMTSSAVFTGSEGSAASTSSSAAPTSSFAAPTVASTASPSSHPSQPSSSSGLATSAKIGVGLGVPFGVTIVAVVAFLCTRHIKHKKKSRLRHSGNIAAVGLYPASDQDMKLNTMQTEMKTDVAASLEQMGPPPVSLLERREPVSPLAHEEDVSPSANIQELHR